MLDIQILKETEYCLSYGGEVSPPDDGSALMKTLNWMGRPNQLTGDMLFYHLLCDIVVRESL